MTATTTTCDLKDFGIDSKLGFLPPWEPLKTLPNTYSAWENVAQNLPKYLAAQSLRKTIDKLTPFPTSALKSDPEIHRAMVILSFIGHAYVFGEEPTSQSIPEVLAKPWYEVAKFLGRPPVLSYESYALDNWQRIDPKGPIAAGNVALLQNFLAGIDEEWFVIVHVDIEARAGKALSAVADGRRAVLESKPDDLLKHLKNLAQSQEEMYKSLCRMPEFCDPYVYYNRVRPYIHGWKNQPTLPNGLIYQGVTEYGNKGQFFRGETGAQSTIIPVLDGFLNVTHKDDPLRTYLQEMRIYMPPKHVKFLEAVESGPSTRDFVMNQANANDLLDCYNQCVKWVETFRTKHLEYAIKYIAKQVQVDASNPAHVGTGGTPFEQYLTKHRDETGAHVVKK